MSRIVFIGDEVTAAGFRLAGLETDIAGSDELADLVRRRKNQCDILLMTTEAARQLPSDLYDDMLIWTRPLVAFLPDVRGAAGPLDLEHAVRRELGIDI